MMARAHGRGATTNPHARFESQARTWLDDGWNSLAGDITGALPHAVTGSAGLGAASAVKTTVTMEAARSIVTKNTSPDVHFDRSINAYRGCEHGCSYCFARPSHAYMGLSPGQDFETQLFAKAGAADLLRKTFDRKGYSPAPIAMGTNTDPYQPTEKMKNITRSLLQVCLDYRHPVTIVTKSALVLRDRDILSELAALNLVKVALSVTTLDRHLARAMEPRASTPQRRLDAIRLLTEAGVPAGALIAPVIPALTDHELEAAIQAVAHAGAIEAGYILLRLPLEVAPIFEDWLHTHVPDKAKRVLRRIESMRGGRRNDPRFGSRMRGEGAEAELLKMRFRSAARKARLNMRTVMLSCDHFLRPQPVPEDRQYSLFSDGLG